MQVFIYRKITLHVSGVQRTHYQEYIKLQLQPLVQVIVYEEQPSSVTKLPWWRKVVAHILRPVPEASVAVLCTPDDGFVGHPKYLE